MNGFKHLSFIHSSWINPFANIRVEFLFEPLSTEKEIKEEDKLFGGKIESTKREELEIMFSLHSVDQRITEYAEVYPYSFIIPLIWIESWKITFI